MKKVLAVALLSFAVAACGSKGGASPSDPSAANANPNAKASAIKKPGEATVGDTAECPVSGEEFDVQATSPKHEHDGKTYFFCCSGCKKKFESNPQKYVKAKGPST
jgi:YHS domain-containing protein